MSSSKVFALVDCNSFFCSCERLFRPDLRGKPVGVLSNNDGCFVSRTTELKQLGVKMGEPYFKVKDLCEKNNVAVFSSNFSLYTNMSDRVMSVLASMAPEIEVYSVDEAFLNLTGISCLDQYIKKIKQKVEALTGIPVSVGVGPSKTLAKVANHVAKKNEALGGVFNLCSLDRQNQVLSQFKVVDLWGVAKATERRLQNLRIYTAKDYRDFKNETLLLKQLTKVGVQRQKELRGESCFPLELSISPKKEIICSRTFGHSVKDFSSLRESVANYVTSASEKLRKQGSVCSEITVYTRTSPFKNVDQYYAMDSRSFSAQTSDTRKINAKALQVIESLYRMGYEYKKAGIKLSGIRDKKQAQLSLFEAIDDERSEALMIAIDRINSKDGCGTVKWGSCGIDNKAWAMNRNKKSPRFVSGWQELPHVNDKE